MSMFQSAPGASPLTAALGQAVNPAALAAMQQIMAQMQLQHGAPPVTPTGQHIGWFGPGGGGITPIPPRPVDPPISQIPGFGGGGQRPVDVIPPGFHSTPGPVTDQQPAPGPEPQAHAIISALAGLHPSAAQAVFNAFKQMHPTIVRSGAGHSGRVEYDGPVQFHPSQSRRPTYNRNRYQGS